MKKDMGQQGKVPDYLEPYVFECHRHELRDFLHKEARQIDCDIESAEHTPCSHTFM